MRRGNRPLLGHGFLVIPLVWFSIALLLASPSASSEAPPPTPTESTPATQAPQAPNHRGEDPAPGAPRRIFRPCGRRSRRGGLGTGARARSAVRDRAGRQRAAPGEDRVSARLRRAQPLRGLPRLRSAGGSDPRPSDRPGRGLSGRFRRSDDRPVQRRTPRLRVLRQSPRRADGHRPQRHDQRRSGRHDMGRDLGRRGTGHRRRLRGRDGDPVHRVAVPAHGRGADLGSGRLPRLSPERSLSDLLRPVRPRSERVLPAGREDRRLRGGDPGPKPRVRSDGHGTAHRRPRRLRSSGEGGPEGRGGALRALGRDAEPERSTRR